MRKNIVSFVGAVSNSLESHQASRSARTLIAAILEGAAKNRLGRNAMLVGIGALVLATALGATPAFANGSSPGSTFDLAVADFPDRVYLGGSLEGAVSISMHDDGSQSARLVQVSLFVDTPLGRATMWSRTMKLMPGQTRTLRVKVPVSEDAATGEFTFVIQATVGNEALSVSHTVNVVGGK